MPYMPLIPTAASWLWMVVVSGAVLLVLVTWGAMFLFIFPRLRVASAAGAQRCEDLLYGVLAFSVLGFAGVLLGFRLIWTFAAISALIASAWWICQKRLRSALGANRRLSEAADARDRWTVALVVIGALVWSIYTLRGLQPAGEGAKLVPWVDFFFHARQIANFAQFRGYLGTLHWTMYGEPVALYHYGSYMVSALVCDISGLPALHLATSLYTVLGTMMTAAALVVLVQAASGRGAALLALALLFLVPDPSAFVPGLGRWNSFFFFQQVGVGGAYAVGTIGLALACALQAMRVRSLSLTTWAGLVFLFAALFKIQIVMAYGVFFFVFLALTATGIRPALRIAGVMGIVGIFVFAVGTLGKIPNAPTMGLSLDSVRRVFHLDAADDLTAAALFPVTAVAVYGLTYGLFLPVVAVLMWRFRKDSSMRSTIAVAVVFMIAHAYVRLLIADNRGFGDASEINRKTFVLPYFVIVYASAVMLWRAIGDFPSFWQQYRIALPVLGMASLCVTLASASRLQIWRGVEYRIDTTVSAGLFGVADQLRRNSTAGELVQLCENDEFNELATLAERPIYVARLMVNEPPMNAIERDRFATLTRLVHQVDASAVVEMARSVHIRWLVMSPSCHADWEKGIHHVYAKDGYRLYGMGSSLRP